MVLAQPAVSPILEGETPSPLWWSPGLRLRLTSLSLQVIDAYYKQVASPGSSGATFLAVCRGKVRPL